MNTVFFICAFYLGILNNSIDTRTNIKCIGASVICNNSTVTVYNNILINAEITNIFNIRLQGNDFPVIICNSSRKISRAVYIILSNIFSFSCNLIVNGRIAVSGAQSLCILIVVNIGIVVDNSKIICKVNAEAIARKRKNQNLSTLQSRAFPQHSYLL